MFTENIAKDVQDSNISMTNKQRMNVVHTTLYLMFKIEALFSSNNAH